MTYHEWQTKYDRLAAVSAKVKHYAEAYMKYMAEADKKHLRRHLGELAKLLNDGNKKAETKQGALL